MSFLPVLLHRKTCICHDWDVISPSWIGNKNLSPYTQEAGIKVAGYSQSTSPRNRLCPSDKAFISRRPVCKFQGPQNKGRDTGNCSILVVKPFIELGADKHSKTKTHMPYHATLSFPHRRQHIGVAIIIAIGPNTEIQFYLCRVLQVSLIQTQNRIRRAHRNIVPARQ